MNVQVLTIEDKTMRNESREKDTMTRFPDFHIPSSVETPSVCVDERLMEQNIGRMASGLKVKGVEFRPHVKSHKSLEIARRQMEAGAVGLTTATIGEAEVFVEGGFEDIFIAYPLWITESKAARIRRMLDNARIAVGVSSVDGAENLVQRMRGADELRVIIEVDSGELRTGVTSPETAVVIADVIAQSGLHFAGVFTHGGHSYAGSGAVARAASDEVRSLLEAADALRSSGHYVETLSAGSTPTALVSSVAGVTEERPGTFVFGDRQQVALGAHPADSVALFVATTVVQVSGNQFVLDAGGKVFTKDLPKTVEGFGALPAYPEARIERLFDHHAVVSHARSMPRTGERVAVIPNHVCPVSNLTDEFVALGVDGEEVDRWRVDARERNR
jgi:D-serine deaminase-like pyridoxal phosphate-dependent protein